MEPTSTDAWTKKRSWGGRFGRQVSKIIRENMRYIQKYTTFNFFLLGFPANVTILVELLVYKNCCSIYCVGGWGLDPYYNSMVRSYCDPFSFPSISTPDKTLCVQLSLSLFNLSLSDPGTTWPADYVLVPCTTLALAQRMAWSHRPQWSGNTNQMKIRHFKKKFWWRSADPHDPVHLQKKSLYLTPSYHEADQYGSIESLPILMIWIIFKKEILVLDCPL